MSRGPVTRRNISFAFGLFAGNVLWHSGALRPVLVRATLAWNPSTSPGIAGYRLYQGGAKGVYTTITDVGAATTAKVSGLVQGRVYFFAVTAYDLAGLESIYSNELTFSPTIAAPPAVALTSPVTGASYVAPATLNLVATVATNGHSITKVRFFSGSSLLGESVSPPYSFVWANVGVGNYICLARSCTIPAARQPRQR